MSATPEPATPQIVPVERLKSISSLVAEGAIFTGHFQSAQDLGIKVDGVVEGNVMFGQGGTIHVGPGGVVQGTRMEADYVYIEGKVRGDVVARKALEITATGTLVGGASYDDLVLIHPRAKVRGKLDYRGDIEGQKAA